jgi:hypothetical protein
LLLVAEANEIWLVGRHLTLSDVRLVRPGYVRFLPRIGAGVYGVPSPASGAVGFGTEVVPATVVPIGMATEWSVGGPMGP